MLSKDDLLKPMLQLATGRALGFAITFMIPVVLVRAIDQTAFGTYKQVFLVYATLYGIAPIGMAECLYYFLPADPARAGRFVANTLIALLASGVLVLVLVVGGSDVVGSALGNPGFAAHATTLGLFAALTMFSSVTEIVMITRSRHRLSAVTYTISDALRALCLVVPALVWHDLHAVMLGATVFAVLRAAATVVYLRMVFRDELRPDLSLLRTQLAYALPFGAAVTLELAQGSLHQFVVAHLYDTATFAIYSVGCLQIPLVDFVATGAGSVLMVKMAERSASARSGASLLLWHDAVRKLAMLLFPLAALTFVAGHELIVLLFTERFRASVPVFLVSTATIVLAALPTDSALRAYSQTGALFGMNVVRLVVVAASIGPLLALLGLTGGAVSVVLGTVAVKAVALERIRRVMGVPAAQLLPWRYLFTTLGISAVAAGLALAAKSTVAGSTLASLAVGGVVFAGAYLGGASLFGVVSGNAPAAPAI